MPESLQPGKNALPGEIKAVYCLTSKGGDIYEAMTRVSVATLRRSNPHATVQIACDETTFARLYHARSRLFQEAHEVTAFQCPDGNDTFRNRHIKTRLRSLIKGPFLFLDSDTVIRKSLAQILRLALDSDIAAAPNHSGDQLECQIWEQDRKNLDELSWDVQSPYVNGGVIFYCDTLGAHTFSQSWHSNWLRNIHKTGRLRDQTALNYTIKTLQTRVAVLPHSFNGQFKTNPGQCRDAVIWHYYSSIDESPTTEFNRAIAEVSPDKPISDQSINRILTAKHPWSARSPIDELIARRIMDRGFMTHSESLWLSGRHARAVQLDISQARLKHAVRSLLRAPRSGQG